MKDVLVLGGTQFFGKRLVEKLIDSGKNVTIATRGLTPDSFGDKVNRLILDREDTSTIRGIFENRSWDVVYDQSCFSPQEASDMADALKGRVKRYIFTSSQAVYDYGVNHKEENFDPGSFSFPFKGRKEYPGYEGYQEAKRASEAVLFQSNQFETVAVRFPIVIGKDDFTNRLKFHVERVMNGEPIGVTNPDVRFSFIMSHEAADFLYKMGESSFVGPINPGSKGDMSLKELFEKIEKLVGRKAILTNELTKTNASPYGLDGSWGVNTDKAASLGYHFSDLNHSIDELIEYYMA
ncbi:NAD-dependent epimerase/dehydratase family protein [Bacillus massilinigeriensis]|uniref:NAD-dependent epimerase/dehydratase family protein n=1 Tax=Bacillus massilionigeriensis TaxID=1805475 RepID=UPI00096AEDD6|nr:NAD-dependent epimerase/dehydratase family protein [Bacillus massilionigeriensis]